MKTLQLKVLVQLAVTVLLLMISVVSSAQSPLRAAAANKDRKKKRHQQRFLETSNGPERTIQELKDFQRNLQEIPCNVPYFLMDSATIAATITGIFSVKVSDLNVQDANQILNNYIPMVEHDVQFMKVCASCESQNLSGYGCEDDDYGYDTIHSGLVLFPVNSNANPASIIDTASLQAWFHFRASVVSAVDAKNWLYTPGFDAFDYGLLSASFGYVSIIPAGTGYGESANLVPSDFDKKSAVTGSLPLYDYAQSYVSASSGGRTVLLKEAMYMGCSGGGYRSIAAADGMRSHDITPVKAMACSAPLKTRSWTPLGFLRSVLSMKAGLSDPLNFSLATLSTSNTRPGVANYNTGQSFLKADKVESLLAMFQDLDSPSVYLDGAAWMAYVMSKYPENFQIGELFWSLPILQFLSVSLENNDTDPCVNNPSLALALNVDKTCEAMDENDLTQTVLEADYPIELCHSKTDDLIVIENVPAPEYLKFELDGPDHRTATLICDALLFGSNEIVKPLIRTDAPTQAPVTDAPTQAPKSPKAEKSNKKSKSKKSFRKA